MKFFSKFFCIPLLLVLTSCGYHFGGNEIASRYKTIRVPYAEGDFDGSFTTELIRQIGTSGIFVYTRDTADLILKVRLIDFDYENIGFRYYENKKDERTSDTIPVETRLFWTAEISLVDAANGAFLLNPVRIRATTDFDHDYYSTKDSINIFSLGQLTDYDEAMDAAQNPLNINLAKKIVDYIADGW